MPTFVVLPISLPELAWWEPQGFLRFPRFLHFKSRKICIVSHSRYSIPRQQSSETQMRKEGNIYKKEKCMTYLKGVFP
jgi:hypothetical protein